MSGFAGLDRKTWFGHATAAVSDDWKMQGGKMEMYITGQPAASMMEIKEFFHWVRWTFKGPLLGIRSAEFDDEGCEALAEALETNKTIQTLNLSTNVITGEGARHIAGILRADKVLEDVNLWNNRIGDDGACHIGDALKANDKLRYLNLWNNRIGEAGASGLADGLSHNTVLEVLDLSMNQCGDGGSAALAKALAIQPVLQKLMLWDNCISEDGAQHWSYMLTQNTALIELHLGGNVLEAKGAECLARGLLNNTTLHKLHLNSCEFGEEGLKHFEDLLLPDDINKLAKGDSVELLTNAYKEDGLLVGTIGTVEELDEEEGTVLVNFPGQEDVDYFEKSILRKTNRKHVNKTVRELILDGNTPDDESEIVKRIQALIRRNWAGCVTDPCGRTSDPS